PLARALKGDGIDALLVSSITHVTYLTGFTGSSALLLLTARGRPVLISDGRYEQQIAEECDGDLEVYIRPHDQTLQQAAVAVVKKAGVTTLGFESQHLTVADLEALSAALPDVAWAPQQGRVEALRAVKDATEVEQIRVAIRAAERAYEMVRATLRPGDT